MLLLTVSICNSAMWCVSTARWLLLTSIYPFSVNCWSVQNPTDTRTGQQSFWLDIKRQFSLQLTCWTFLKIPSRSDPFCGTSQSVYIPNAPQKHPCSWFPDFRPRAMNTITPCHQWELFNSSQMNYSVALITEDWWTCCHCLFGSVSGWIAVKAGTYLCSPQEKS